MTPRLIVALVAAILFVLAGFTAYNESGSYLRLTFMWLGFAMAALSLAVGMPNRSTRP